MSDPMNLHFTGTPVASLPGKLKSARRGVGLSTRAVAERLLARRFAISHATIANYEKGRTAPTLPVLAALADLYERPLNWFLESGPALTGVRYRNLRSKVRVADRQRYEVAALRWLEAYLKLEERLKKPLVRRAPALSVSPEETGAHLAKRLRKELDLGDGPIPSMVELLERFAIRVIELPTDMRIDAMAARMGNKQIVVLNPNAANDRCRLNAGHELGHVAFGDIERCEADDMNPSEKRAYEFASHLILPDCWLKEAFHGQSMVRLVQFKERFGISLAAMIYRAEHSGLLRRSEAKWLWLEFAKRGWRTREPGKVRPDRATRFEQLLDGALAEKKLSWREATTLMGVREDEIRNRLELAMGNPASAAAADLGADEEKEGGQEEQVLQFPF